jgi:hypothetical protein
MSESTYITSSIECYFSYYRLGMLRFLFLGLFLTFVTLEAHAPPVLWNTIRTQPSSLWRVGGSAVGRAGQKGKI